MWHRIQKHNITLIKYEQNIIKRVKDKTKIRKKVNKKEVILDQACIIIILSPVFLVSCHTAHGGTVWLKVHTPQLSSLMHSLCCVSSVVFHCRFMLYLVPRFLLHHISICRTGRKTLTCVTNRSAGEDDNVCNRCCVITGSCGNAREDSSPIFRSSDDNSKMEPCIGFYLSPDFHSC